jgi:hypothetical protein
LEKKFIRQFSLMQKCSMHCNSKSRLNSGKVCYHSVQNLLSSRLLSKHVRSRFSGVSGAKVRTNFIVSIYIYFPFSHIERFQLQDVSAGCSTFQLVITLWPWWYVKPKLT